jgi:uncharacterized phiE125 gp8 family phage protein
MPRVIQPTLTVVTPNEGEVLDLEYVRTHVRAVTDVEDELLQGYVAAAAAYWEEQTGRPILHTVFELWLDGFPMTVGASPTRIVLPRAPLVSVDAVSYVDGEGNVVAFSDGASPETVSWRAVAPQGLHAACGWVEPISGLSWPTPALQSDAAQIRFTAGYAATADDVPPLIKAHLLMLVGAMDQFRGSLHYSEGARVEKVPADILDLTAFKYTNHQVLWGAW